MIDETLQFEISQYLDGDLPEPRRVAIERILAEDPEVCRHLDELRRLDSLVAGALPVPEIDFETISRSVSEQIDRRSVPQRVVPKPAAIFGTLSLGRIVGLALAASMLLAVSLWAVLDRGETSLPAVGRHLAGAGQSDSGGSLAISVLTGERPSGEPQAQITIGPSAFAQSLPIRSWYSDYDPDRPASVTIAAEPGLVEDESFWLLQ